MAKKKTKREIAQEKITALMTAIEELYLAAEAIADEAGVSFYAHDPKERSTQYYPKRPDDWVVWNEREDDADKDPNENHPEHESYHPWNEGGEYEYDWSQGHWISSSERC